MTNFTRMLAAAAAIGGLAVPATAQYYPQPSYPQYPQQTYPQPSYPQYPQQTYPQPGYPQQTYPGYGQPGTGNPVSDIIDSLLGNRYSVTDRQAVRQCSNAARAQAMQQYGGYNGYNGYNNNNGYRPGYGYQQQGFAAPSMRVTAITNVERRYNSLRVTGRLSSGYAGQYGGQYGNQYGYQNRNSAMGDIAFRCDVDYRGAVTNIRINRNNEYRRY